MDSPDPLQYDAFADEYEDHAAVAPYNALYDRPAVLELLGDVAGTIVFDAGCGPGLYAAELVRRGATVIGCDASPAMVELARHRVGGDTELRVHDLNAPLDWMDDESVDLAISALVHHYIDDRVGALQELYRILRPRGALVLTTGHPTADWRRLGGSYFAVQAATETWSHGWNITAWRMPLGEMCREFAEAGFVIERLSEPRPAPEMEEVDPESFAKLQVEPAFIAFRLGKG